VSGFAREGSFNLYNNCDGYLLEEGLDAREDNLLMKIWFLN